MSAANGSSGTGNRQTPTRSIFPPLDSIATDDRPSEKHVQPRICEFRYGRFDYFHRRQICQAFFPEMPVCSGLAFPVEKAVARGHRSKPMCMWSTHHGSNRPGQRFSLFSQYAAIAGDDSCRPGQRRIPSQDSRNGCWTKRLYSRPARTSSSRRCVSRRKQASARAPISFEGPARAYSSFVLSSLRGPVSRCSFLDDTTSEATVVSVQWAVPEPLIQQCLRASAGVRARGSAHVPLLARRDWCGADSLH